jgi:ABC-type branched-subunit amino acid transport system substrate-binding protein
VDSCGEPENNWEERKRAEADENKRLVKEIIKLINQVKVGSAGSYDAFRAIAAALGKQQNKATKQHNKR